VSRDESLAKGKAAFASRAWAEAHRYLGAVDADSPLALDDLEQLAMAAYLVGKDADAIALWKRLHRQLIDLGEPERAARWAFWLCLTMLLGGEGAQSRGWLARAQRLLEDHPGCAECGLLCVIAGLFEMFGGRATKAIEHFDEAIECLQSYPDDDLMAFGLLSRGQALIQDQRLSDGVALLDEAMVTVISGGVSPMAAGIVYCAVILTSQSIQDLERAREWTAALDEWCASQPEMVPFRGACLLHRSEILQLQGKWPDALEEAQRSCEWFSDRVGRSDGRAFYQLAELHRLRGDFEDAETMYREAGRNGKEPQPGMSLLRLAQGDLDSAVTSIRRMVGEAPRAWLGAERATVMVPYVEIMLAAGDVGSARAVADELAAVVAKVETPFLRAQSALALGAVALAEGDPTAALSSLRQAWAIWQRLEVPYEAARARVLIARACEQVGDHDTARIHLDAARTVFERLEATPAVSQLDDAEESASDVESQLTRREREVLALVAAGDTNRQIAEVLGISEHTVARHMSNIFNKIDVTTRTAAATFALKQGLI